MTTPASDDVDLREPSSCEKLAALQLRGDGLYTDASGSVFDADEYAEIRDAAKDEELADLRQQLATAQAARERAEGERDAAFRECAKWAARCGEAEGKLQGSELAGVVRDWQERADAAESRLAKVGALAALAAEWREVASHEMGRGARFIDLAYELEAAMKVE